MTKALHSPYRAYAMATHTVAKTKQVVMLYDGMIRFIQQASDAIDNKDFETRYNQLNKAAEIANGLQASLDFEKGGEIAKILYDFYSVLDMRIQYCNRTSDKNLCQQMITELKTMRDAWDHVDSTGSQSEAPKVSIAAAPGASAVSAASMPNLSVSV